MARSDAASERSCGLTTAFSLRPLRVAIGAGLGNPRYGFNRTRVAEVEASAPLRCTGHTGPQRRPAGYVYGHRSSCPTDHGTASKG